MKLYTLRYRILRRLRLALNERTLRAAMRLGRMQQKREAASNPKLPIYEIVPLTPQAGGPFVWVDKTQQHPYEQKELIPNPRGSFFKAHHLEYMQTNHEMPAVQSPHIENIEIPDWLNDLVRQEEEDKTEPRLPAVKRKAG